MDPVRKALVSDYLGSWLRTGIAAISGYLIAGGIADAEQAENLSAALIALIPGALVYAGVQFASLYNKQMKAPKAVLKAGKVSSIKRH